MDDHPTILFDGHCGLCNRVVDFVIRHDPDARFRFAALQSPAGIRVLGHGAILGTVDSVILVVRGRARIKSDAVLITAHLLGAPWSLFSYFRWVPRSWRDAVYDLVARNRTRLFGRSPECRLPSAAERSRFLHED